MRHNVKVLKHDFSSLKEDYIKLENARIHGLGSPSFVESWQESTAKRFKALVRECYEGWQQDPDNLDYRNLGREVEEFMISWYIPINYKFHNRDSDNGEYYII